MKIDIHIVTNSGGMLPDTSVGKSPEGEYSPPVLAFSHILQSSIQGENETIAASTHPNQNIHLPVASQSQQIEDSTVAREQATPTTQFNDTTPLHSFLSNEPIHRKTDTLLPVNVQPVNKQLEEPSTTAEFIDIQPHKKKTIAATHRKGNNEQTLISAYQEPTKQVVEKSASQQRLTPTVTDQEIAIPSSKEKKITVENNRNSPVIEESQDIESMIREFSTKLNSQTKNKVQVHLLPSHNEDIQIRVDISAASQQEIPRIIDMVIHNLWVPMQQQKNYIHGESDIAISAKMSETAGSTFSQVLGEESARQVETEITHKKNIITPVHIPPQEKNHRVQSKELNISAKHAEDLTPLRMEVADSSEDKLRTVSSNIENDQEYRDGTQSINNGRIQKRTVPSEVIQYTDREYTDIPVDVHAEKKNVTSLTVTDNEGVFSPKVDIHSTVQDFSKSKLTTENGTLDELRNAKRNKIDTQSIHKEQYSDITDIEYTPRTSTDNKQKVEMNSSGAVISSKHTDELSSLQIPRIHDSQQEKTLQQYIETLFPEKKSVATPLPFVSPKTNAESMPKQERESHGVLPRRDEYGDILGAEESNKSDAPINSSPLRQQENGIEKSLGIKDLSLTQKNEQYRHEFKSGITDIESINDVGISDKSVEGIETKKYSNQIQTNVKEQPVTFKGSAPEEQEEYPLEKKGNNVDTVIIKEKNNNKNDDIDEQRVLIHNEHARDFIVNIEEISEEHAVNDNNAHENTKHTVQNKENTNDKTDKKISDGTSRNVQVTNNDKLQEMSVDRNINEQPTRLFSSIKNETQHNADIKSKPTNAENTVKHPDIILTQYNKTSDVSQSNNAAELTTKTDTEATIHSSVPNNPLLSQRQSEVPQNEENIRDYYNQGMQEEVFADEENNVEIKNNTTSINTDKNIDHAKKNRDERYYSTLQDTDDSHSQNNRGLTDFVHSVNDSVNHKKERHSKSTLIESQDTYQINKNNSLTVSTTKKEEISNISIPDEDYVHLISIDEVSSQKENSYDTPTATLTPQKSKQNQPVVGNHDLSLPSQENISPVPEQEILHENTHPVSSNDISKNDDHPSIQNFTKVGSIPQDKADHRDTVKNRDTHTVNHSSAEGTNEKKLTDSKLTSIAKDDDNFSQRVNTDEQDTRDLIARNSTDYSGKKDIDVSNRSTDVQSKKLILQQEEIISKSTFISENTTAENLSTNEKGAHTRDIATVKDTNQHSLLSTLLPEKEQKVAVNNKRNETEHHAKVIDDTEELLQKELPTAKSVHYVAKPDDKGTSSQSSKPIYSESQTHENIVDTDIHPQVSIEENTDIVSDINDSKNTLSEVNSKKTITPVYSEIQDSKDSHLTLGVKNPAIQYKSINKSVEFDNILPVESKVNVISFEEFPKELSHNEDGHILRSDSVSINGNDTDSVITDTYVANTDSINESNITDSHDLVLENKNSTLSTTPTTVKESYRSFVRNDVNKGTSPKEYPDNIVTNSINSTETVTGNKENTTKENSIYTHDNAQDTLLPKKILTQVLSHDSVNKNIPDHLNPVLTDVENIKKGDVPQRISTENTNITREEISSSPINNNTLAEDNEILTTLKNDMPIAPSMKEGDSHKRKIVSKESLASYSQKKQIHEIEHPLHDEHILHSIHEIGIEGDKPLGAVPSIDKRNNGMSVKSNNTVHPEKKELLDLVPVHDDDAYRTASVDDMINEDSHSVSNESEEQKEIRNFSENNSTSKAVDHTLIQHPPLQTNNASVYVLKNQTMDNAAIVITAPNEKTVQEYSLPTTAHALHAIIEKASSVGVPVKNIVFKIRSNDNVSSEKNVLKKDTPSSSHTSSTIKYSSTEELQDIRTLRRGSEYTVPTVTVPDKFIQSKIAPQQISAFKEKDTVASSVQAIGDLQSKNSENFLKIFPDKSAQNHSENDEKGSFKKESLLKRPTLKNRQSLHIVDHEQSTQEPSISFVDRLPTQRTERNLHTPQNDNSSMNITESVDKKYTIQEEQSFAPQAVVQPLMTNESIGTRGNEIVEPSHSTTAIIQPTTGHNIHNKQSIPTIKKSFDAETMTSIPIHQFSEKAHEYISARTPSDGSVRMVLQPEELGTVIVRYATQNTDAQLQIQVDSQQTKQIIESQLPQLKEQFTKQGMQLDRVDVIVRKKEEDMSNSSQYSSNNRQGQSQQEQESRQQFTRSFKYAAEARKAQTTLNYTSSAFNRIFQTQR